MSQKSIVLAKLKSEGSISNLWAIQNGMWRLGAIIKDLRDEGFDIETDYQPSKTKVTTYRFKSKPKEVTLYKLPDGREIISKRF